MKSKVFLAAMMLIFVAVYGASVQSQEATAESKTSSEKAVVAEGADSTALGEDTTLSKVAPAPADRVVAYYFHGTRRCANCKKIEAYSREAVEKGFPDELESGLLEWRVINIDEPENRHYVDDYKLYTKSVIVTGVHDTTETDWKNLEKIWQLLGSKEKFIEYVRKEVRTYLAEK
jgi:hypothetical protein